MDNFCLLNTLDIRRCVQKLQRHSAQTQLRSAQQTTPFPLALPPTNAHGEGNIYLLQGVEYFIIEGGGGMWEISSNITTRCEEVCKKEEIYPTTD